MVQWAITEALSKLWKWAALLDLIADIVKDILFNSMAEEDMRQMAEKFA